MKTSLLCIVEDCNARCHHGEACISSYIKEKWTCNHHQMESEIIQEEQEEEDNGVEAAEATSISEDKCGKCHKKIKQGITPLSCSQQGCGKVCHIGTTCSKIGRYKKIRTSDTHKVEEEYQLNPVMVQAEAAEAETAKVVLNPKE